MSNFKERCEVSTKCLPPAEYRTQLEALHKEMLDSITELEFYKENKTCMGCWGEIHQCGCGAAERA